MRITQWLRWASAAALVLGSVLSAEAQEIKFWTLTFDNPDVTKAFNTIIKDFEAANPGVTIKLENRATDEYKAALRVAAQSDQAPDIYFMWAGLGLGGEFIKSGLALNMDKYYKEYKWDDEFIPPALAFSKQYEGGRYGVPFTFRGEGLYYNKALFKKAGITTLPKTYDELVADADKLAVAGFPAITFGGTVNWHLMRLLDEILEVECGPEKHDALMAMKANWAEEPCATKSFEELHKWTSKYILKPFMGIDNNQSFNLFLAGRAAMMLEGNWLVGQLRNAKRLADYAVFPFPGTTRLYGFGEYNYISTKSKNPDIAAKFLNYLKSTPVQQANLVAFGGYSVNKNVKSDSKDPLDLEWAKIFSEFNEVFVNGDQAFPLDVTTEYWRIMNEVASDHLDPKAAPGELQKFITARK